MNNIKVRFAPSPTGHMHIGNTRTALFNWLLAKKLGGCFMLRIDDTDRERSKREYEDSLRESLLWLGLNWTEEARQSARLERYYEIVEKLKAQGRIYECWETPEELELMRKRLIARGLPPIYSRDASALSDEEIALRRKQGRRPHYRFRLTAGEIRWHDMVRGEVRYDAGKLSDPIVIREDGSFLYHLPSVIDDVDFGITHIVRGEDHVSNTAVQIEMFEALGGKIPQFAAFAAADRQRGKTLQTSGVFGCSRVEGRRRRSAGRLLFSGQNRHLGKHNAVLFAGGTGRFAGFRAAWDVRSLSLTKLNFAVSIPFIFMACLMKMSKIVPPSAKLSGMRFAAI